jgi:hypothetical protein
MVMSYRWYHSIIFVCLAIGFFIFTEFSSSTFLGLSESAPNFRRVEKRIQDDLLEAESYAQVILSKSNKLGISKIFKIFSAQPLPRKTSPFYYSEMTNLFFGPIALIYQIL